MLNFPTKQKQSPTLRDYSLHNWFINVELGQANSTKGGATAGGWISAVVRELECVAFNKTQSGSSRLVFKGGKCRALQRNPGAFI